MTTLTKIYRFESSNGAGIYSDINVRMCNMPQISSSYQPDPYDDKCLRQNLKNSGFAFADLDKFHFGFNSVEQIKAWFPHKFQLEFLHDNNCHLLVIEIDKMYVIHGDAQVIFRMETVETALKVSIAEFFELETEYA